MKGRMKFRMIPRVLASATGWMVVPFTEMVIDYFEEFARKIKDPIFDMCYFKY